MSVEPKEGIDYVEKKENKQLKYIEEYAKANNLIPMKILRKGVLGASGKRAVLGNAVKLLEKGVAEAILVANMEAISYGIKVEHVDKKSEAISKINQVIVRQLDLKEL